MTDSDTNLDGPPWEEDDVAPRDENTDDMFGAPAAAPEPVVAPAAAPVAKPAPAEVAAHVDDGAAYQVLARKYRPRTFEDLIGQEAMVR
ncbi:MAG: DNA polymerase-3 subunit gamma/tau, partial [Brevundimonas sp.]